MKSDDTTDARGDVLGELLERERQLLARNEELLASIKAFLDVDIAVQRESGGNSLVTVGRGA